MQEQGIAGAGYLYLFGQRGHEQCRPIIAPALDLLLILSRNAQQGKNHVEWQKGGKLGNDLGMSYFALQEDLERLFGRPVDLVPKEGLHRAIRDQVLGDAQVLYAA